MKILMNSSMMPKEGDYKLRKVSKNEFINKWRQSKAEMNSSIGYPKTAKFLSNLLRENVPVDRSPTFIKDGDIAFICKLKYRLNNPALKKGYCPKESDFDFFIMSYKQVKSDSEKEEKSHLKRKLLKDIAKSLYDKLEEEDLIKICKMTTIDEMVTYYSQTDSKLCLIDYYFDIMNFNLKHNLNSSSIQKQKDMQIIINSLNHIRSSENQLK